MCRVVTHAQPAKLMATLAARHVHAPLILLNGVLALRALLSVQLDPIFCVLIASANPIEPLIE